MPQQLNHLWQYAPKYVQAALRQRDGVWQLAKPLAWVEDGWRVLPFELTVLPQTTSTSDELLQRVRAGLPVHKRVVAALEQTAGRGRQGRAWQTQLGESLMFSVGWSWDKPQHELTALALVAALACRRGLARAGCDVRIKWPNDLVVGLDKLGGILIETVRQNGQTHTIIGIGINFINAGAVPGRIGVQAACNVDRPMGEQRQKLPAVLQQGNALCEFRMFGGSVQQCNQLFRQQQGVARHNIKPCATLPFGFQQRRQDGRERALFAGQAVGQICRAIGIRIVSG